MLRFKEYRNKYTEADAVSDKSNDELQRQIDQAVDAWTIDLKKTLILGANADSPVNNTGTGGGRIGASGTPKQRGLWDRFKNTMANLWHGRSGQDNPYYWQNKLGDDLGVAHESFNPIPFNLHEYKYLKEVCDSLEVELNELVDPLKGTENLRISRLIDIKAQELKKRLFSIFTGIKLPKPYGMDVDALSRHSAAPSSVEPTKASTPMAAAPLDAVNSDEPDSKPSVGHKLLSDLVIQLGRNGTLDQNAANELEKALLSPKQSIRDKAEKEAESMGVFNSKKPTKPNAFNPSAAPIPDDSASAPKKSEFTTPPTQGKKWEELSPDEKSKWNEYGGGISHGQNTKIDGCLNDHGILRMPWILRIGDPRRQILTAQKEGKLPQSTRCANKKTGSHWFDFLQKTGRWEDEAHPIASEDELRAHVAKAEQLTKELRKKRGVKPVASDAPVDSMKPNEITPEAPVPPEVKTPDVAPEVKAPEPMPSQEKAKETFFKSDLPIPEPKQGGEGVSEPMHKSDIPGAEAIPAEKEAPKIRKPRISRKEKEFNAKKDELKNRIETELTDANYKEKLLNKLANAKDESDLEKVKIILGEVEEDFSRILP
jgi:hypothetical protein